MPHRHRRRLRQRGGREPHQRPRHHRRRVPDQRRGDRDGRRPRDRERGVPDREGGELQRRDDLAGVLGALDLLRGAVARRRPSHHRALETLREGHRGGEDQGSHRGEKLLDSRRGRPEHVPSLRRRRERLRSARVVRGERHRDRAGRVRVQHHRRRGQERRHQGAERGARPLLPQQDGHDRRPRRPRARRADAPPTDEGAALRAQDGLQRRPPSRRRHGRLEDAPHRRRRRRVEPGHVAGGLQGERDAGGHGRVHAARRRLRGAEPGHHRLLRVRGGGVALQGVAPTRHQRRHPEQKSEQRAVGLLQGAPIDRARRVHALLLRGHRRRRAADHLHRAQPRRLRRPREKDRGDLLRDAVLHLQHVRRRRRLLRRRKEGEGARVHGARPARRPQRHGRREEGGHPRARGWPGSRVERRPGRVVGPRGAARRGERGGVFSGAPRARRRDGGEDGGGHRSWREASVRRRRRRRGRDRVRRAAPVRRDAPVRCALRER
mmetsp:Transcript_7399/g.27071  ORF Transcript_7399/g.27071 Transcript_7399/m.27071 type:complete len:493 (+) Transcript_7399:1066-2544(+)